MNTVLETYHSQQEQLPVNAENGKNVKTLNAAPHILIQYNLWYHKSCMYGKTRYVELTQVFILNTKGGRVSVKLMYAGIYAGDAL